MPMTDNKPYLWPTGVKEAENKPVLIIHKPDGTIYALDIAHISNRAILKMIAAGTDMKEVYAKVKLYYDRQLNSVVDDIMMLPEYQCERSGTNARNSIPEYIEIMRDMLGTMGTYDVARELYDVEMLLNEA
jgi:hypothetical protein